jgi:putative transposase
MASGPNLCRTRQAASRGDVPAYAAGVPRRPRSLLPDGIYHVTTRGVAGAPIYLTDADRRLFLELLADVVTRFGWLCHAFCLMDTHYHLVVETTLTRLSAGVHRLNGLYAMRFNAVHDRRGHLFGDRFWASLVDSEKHLEAACRYVLANPVRAGVCDQPSAWPWSRSRYGADVV